MNMLINHYYMQPIISQKKQKKWNRSKNTILKNILQKQTFEHKKITKNNKLIIKKFELAVREWFIIHINYHLDY